MNFILGLPRKRVAFHTLGCKLNFSESSTIARDFVASGFETVDYKEKADIYVLNTCSVTENADKEAKKLIRQAKRKNPSSIVAVIGCYAQLKPKEIELFEEVDLILGSNEKFRLVEILNDLDIKNNSRVFHSHINNNYKFTPSYSSKERTRSFLKIQDGCDYNCSFCTIPLARGKSRSDTIENTISLAQNISETDAKEIVLTGVNIGDFGKKNGETFFDLIKQLDKINNINRIRISSIEPNLLNDQIIEFCNKSEKFVPHFHIPLQSGSDKILKKMYRRYNKSLYRNRIEMIKSIDKNVCIGADVIVGFPGETDEDFIETYDFLDELNLSYLHVFTYSERANTAAADCDKKVPKEIKMKRSRKLRALSNEKRNYFFEKLVGSNRPVLFEKRKNHQLVGFTDNYVPVHINGSLDLLNTIQDVYLNKNKGDFMEGYLKHYQFS